MDEKSVTVDIGGSQLSDLNKPRKTIKRQVKQNQKENSHSYKKLKQDLIKKLAKYRSDVQNFNQEPPKQESSFGDTLQTLNTLENKYEQKNSNTNNTPSRTKILDTDYDTMVQHVKNEPVYGCLKSGKKKTLKQLKNDDKQNFVSFVPYNSSVHIDTIDSRLKNRQQQFLLLKNKRKQELNTNTNVIINDNSITNTNSEITSKIQNENTTDQSLVKHEPKESIQPKRTKKVKRIKKTCRIGKYDGKVVVLLPNQKTRKKIEKDVCNIDSLSLYKVKEYLRSKHLISVGCTAPESILRETMKNSLLSGDIEKDKASLKVSDLL